MPSGDKYQEVAYLEKEAILQDLRQDLLNYKSIRAKTSLHLEKSLGSKDVVQVFVAKRPDKFRLEFFVPGINHLAAILVSKHSELTYVDFTEKQAYQGIGDKETLEQIISIPIGVRELIVWLSGKAFLPDIEVSNYKVYRQDKKLLLKETFKDGRIINFYLAEVASESKNKKYQVEFSEIYSKEKKLIFQSKFLYRNSQPSSISFTLPEQNAKGDIEFEKFLINPDLSKTEERLFNFKIPDDMPTQRLNYRFPL